MRDAGGVILIVDDDDDIRESLSELLMDEGYKTVGVANGKEALDYVRANPLPCLILLDLMMPVMSGWELHQHLCADPRLASIPVIVITAAGEHQLKSIAAKEIFPKPLPLDRVLLAVEQYC